MKSCPVCKSVYPVDFTVCPKDGVGLRHITEFQEGAVIRGKYEILSKLGAGGMGTVYKARHLHFNEICALKVVKSHLLEEAEFLQRFRSEALVMRRLNHPNAVQVRDYDETEDGRPFMVLEFVDGPSLDQALASGEPLEPLRAIRIAGEVAEALSAAHQLGIVHRDIKPSNILLATDPDGSERAKVLDFGVAKVKEGSNTLHRASLTGTGFVVGTPEYMSPEQAMGTKGDSLDGRTDLYSLGVVLYEMLTGRLPFTANTPVMMLVAHVQTQPTNPLSVKQDLPPALARLVLRALEKNPDHRFPTADAMREELESIAQQLRPPAPRVQRTPTTASGARSQPAVPAVAPPSVPRAAPAPPPRPAAAAPARAMFQQPPPEEPSIWRYIGIGGGLALVAGIAFLTVSGKLGWPTRQTTAPQTELPPAQTVPAPQAQPPARVETTPAEPPPKEAAPTEDERTLRAILREARDAYERGDRETARTLLEEAHKRAPNNPEVREARQRMRRALLAKEPPPAARVPRVDAQKVQQFIQDGRAAMDRGDYDDAIRAFEAAVVLDPSHADAQRGLDRARKAKAAEEELLRKPK
ncbi:MAG TPA: protein kinase [Candidatus Xenobia bacterium]|nr:protein kinase [Candidatus Xenobia bacterium]